MLVMLACCDLVVLVGGWICYVCWFYFSLLVVYCGLKVFVGLVVVWLILVVFMVGYGFVWRFVYLLGCFIWWVVAAWVCGWFDCCLGVDLA